MRFRCNDIFARIVQVSRNAGEFFENTFVFVEMLLQITWIFICRIYSNIFNNCEFFLELRCYSRNYGENSCIFFIWTFKLIDAFCAVENNINTKNVLITLINEKTCWKEDLSKSTDYVKLLEKFQSNVELRQKFPTIHISKRDDKGKTKNHQNPYFFLMEISPIVDVSK